MMAWDITALGLPAAGMPFVQGTFRQHLEIKRVWLERGTVRASDTRWMNSPLGLAGQKCMATLVFARGSAIESARLERGLASARERMEAHSLRLQAGVTSPHPNTMVARVMSPVTEPAMQLLKQIWAAWRQDMWQLSSTHPRLWNL